MYVPKWLYGFIDSLSYFNESLGSIFNGASAHWVDYNLSQSKNPEKDIKKYKNKAYSTYCSMGYKSNNAKGMANAIENYLNNYNDRREELFSIFKDYIED